MEKPVLNKKKMNEGRVNASARVDKNREKIETARPFEPRVVQLWSNSFNFSSRGGKKKPDACTLIKVRVILAFSSGIIILKAVDVSAMINLSSIGAVL